MQGTGRASLGDTPRVTSSVRERVWLAGTRPAEGLPNGAQQRHQPGLPPISTPQAQPPSLLALSTSLVAPRSVCKLWGGGR